MKHVSHVAFLAYLLAVWGVAIPAGGAEPGGQAKDATETAVDSVQGAINAELTRYYPQSLSASRAYLVRDDSTGQAMQTIGKAMVSTQAGNGSIAMVMETRHAGGIELEFEELDGDRLLLRRLMTLHRVPGKSLVAARVRVVDAYFTPPLVKLHAPLDVGRTWESRAAVGNLEGGKPLDHTYAVTATLSYAVSGMPLPDCLRVERSSRGQPDYRSIYCRRAGLVEFAQPTRKGDWIRSELFLISRARLELVALHDKDGQCEHIFVLHGLQPDEKMAFTVKKGPGEETDAPIQPVVQAASNFIHVGLGNNMATRGRWLIEAEGLTSREKTATTLDWHGICRADFLTPTPVGAPGIALIGQETDASGRVNLQVIGTGWRPGESLRVQQRGPSWGGTPADVGDIGQANQMGLSGVVSIPLPARPLPGTHHIDIWGEGRQATLTAECSPSEFCYVVSGQGSQP